MIFGYFYTCYAFIGFLNLISAGALILVFIQLENPELMREFNEKVYDVIEKERAECEKSIEKEKDYGKTSNDLKVSNAAVVASVEQNIQKP